jgi:alkane 1-monooxygenase
MSARILVLRYSLTNTFLLCFAAALMVGGWPIWAVLALAVLTAGGIDETVGDERSSLGEASRLSLDVNLYATLPLLLTITYFLLALIAWGPTREVAVLRAPSFGPSLPIVGAIIGTGFLYALAGATVGHELAHRVSSPAALLSARLLFAFTFNASFESYHLSGHHRNVGTYGDAATARRGEYVLAFVMRTLAQQSSQGWHLESNRLRQKGVGVWSYHNRILGGLLCSTLILATSALMAGIAGSAAFLLAAVLGRFLHEAVNYFQHYGLVRCEGAPVEARHSWDCDRHLSNVLHYNLPRHADHHMFASKPFWKLAVVADSPKLPYGYATMSMIALFPNWWNRLMGERLRDWDQRLASEFERSIVRRRGWTIAH